MKRYLWPLIFALGIPLSIFILSPDYIFRYTSHPCLDTWFYTGLFWEYDRLDPFFKSLYYAGRLPWILIGRSLTWLEPTIFAYTLRLLLSAISIAGFFYIAKMVSGKRSAVLASLALGYSSFFWWSISWDYPDGICQVFFILSLSCLVGASKTPRPARLLALASFCACLAVFCHLYAVIYVFALVPLAYFLTQHKTARPRKEFFKPIALGIIVAFYGFGLLSLTLGGKFMFVNASTGATHDFMSEPNSMVKALMAWVGRANFLIIPFLAFVASALTLLRQVLRHDIERNTWVLHTSYVALFLFAAFIEVIGFHSLQVSYYASFLIPIALIVLFSSIAPALNQLSRRQFGLLALSTGALWAAHPLLIFPHFPQFLTKVSTTQTLLYGAGAGALALLVHALWPRSRVVAIAFITAVSLAHLYNSDELRISKVNRDVYGAVVTGIGTYLDIDPEQKSLFWFNKLAPNATIHTGVMVGSFAWLKRGIGNDFPGVHYHLLYKLEDSPNVITFSAEPNDPRITHAWRNLQPLGLELFLLGARPVNYGDISYQLVGLRIPPLSPPLPVPQQGEKHNP